MDPCGRDLRRLAKALSEFKILDPCCGSGHFLVAAFLMLVPMRMELEGYPPGRRWTPSCAKTSMAWRSTSAAWRSPLLPWPWPPGDTRSRGIPVLPS